MGNCVKAPKDPYGGGSYQNNMSNYPQSNYGGDGYNAVSYVPKPYPLEKDDEVLAPLLNSNPNRPPYAITAALSFGWDSFQPKKGMHNSVPCALVLTAPDQPAEDRVGVDIVCVIDISGSMSGEKIEMVTKTLNFMIAQLSEIDRLCIIEFNNRAQKLMPLTVMNNKGKAFASTVANHLVAGGGTNIVEGLRYALTVALMRNMVNYTIDILLLSDGEDNDQASSLYRMRDCFASFDQYNISYAVHTFGYGHEHDSELLGEIAHIHNGSFHFVEEPRDISDSFSHCLGEILSVVGRDVRVSLLVQPCPIPFSIGKVHSECGTINFRLPNICCGTTKEAVFILEFPPCNIDMDKCTITPVSALVTYQMVLTGECINQEIFLSIEMNIGAKSVEIYKGVMLHFYRSRGAEILKNTGILGEQGQFEEARYELENGIKELKKSEYHNDPMIKLLIKDLERSRNKVKHQESWERGGHAHFRFLHHAHWAKRGDDLYLNNMQKKIKATSRNYF